MHRRYFSSYSTSKGLFYALSALFVISTSLVVLFEPIIPVWCGAGAADSSIEYPNPSYVYYPCRHRRYPHLLFLTPEECDFGRRLVASVLFGAIIGWERREADRPAGIRTMALVSLASALFTICSAFAFISGPMAWDSSRISAAIPSGVGFLGAGLIFQEANKDELTGESQHVVHGLTTATSVWLSAAVGVACGGELYFISAFSTAIMLLLLRFGPRQVDPEDDEKDEKTELVPPRPHGTVNKPTLSAGRGNAPSSYGATRLTDKDGVDHEPGEMDSMLPRYREESERTSASIKMRRSDLTKSSRSRAGLSTAM